MLHRKRAGAVVLAGLAVAALVASGTPAFATNDPGRPRPPTADQEPQPDKPLNVAPPSTEDVPPGFASWDEVFELQSKLNAAADRIVAAGGDGYAGLVADPDNRDVRLYWKGEVPAAVRGAVDEGRRSVPVQVLPADYTRVELEAEARRWHDSGLAVQAYPASDGSGVVVGVAGTGTAPKLPGGERTRYVVEFEQSAPDPLAAEAPATTLVDYNRQFDRAPYWGGAMYYNDGWGCTLGFPITDWWGDPGMLTAGHCGDPSDTVTTTNQWNVFGQFWDQNDAVDIAHIWVYSSVEPFVYVGGLTSSQGRRLIGAGNNHSGNYVC
ncbi:hypothetical protein AB0M20_41915, partial [Actinoplanes sp. NPDC051633]|uniref:hypothetical protein n=1 Tax=Actinoplanes sp. NPDC051633 TaxID=3155670 RepID=UPI0034479733